MPRERVTIFTYFCDTQNCDAETAVANGDQAPTKRGYVWGQVDADAQVKRAGWYASPRVVRCPNHQPPGVRHATR